MTGNLHSFTAFYPVMIININKKILYAYKSNSFVRKTKKSFFG